MQEIGRTAHTASAAQRAKRPEPMSASVDAFSSARYFAITPQGAVLRTACTK